ncbi:hypothetical protein DFH09DRAFT_911716 [Mycena vulgaris]|nr:hypothetical protein DFH09DRAFT_911716 [Mycena vulgaris]
MSQSSHRLQQNLGEAKHGKLKAQEYLILFSVILPLILPELWWNGDEAEKKLLENFYDLIACTNIISSYSTSNSEADTYAAHYFRYRGSLPELFPGSYSKPNHHFAAHNPELLKFWGPLACVSEFPGERLNSILGRVKHNRRIRDIPTTMLRQVTRRGCLEAYLNEEQFTTGHTRGLAHILDPSSVKVPEQLEPSEVAKILSSAEELFVPHYQMLLLYLQSNGQPWRHHLELPHPDGALILPPCALQSPEFQLDGRNYSCKHSHLGNSGIQFKRPSDSQIFTGFIESIWQIPLQGHMQTFVVVELHTSLPHNILAQLPFSSKPRLNTTVVDATPSGNRFIIEPRHILTHLTTYKRPKGAFGIN